LYTNTIFAVVILLYTWGRNGFDGIVETWIAGRGFS